MAVQAAIQSGEPGIIRRKRTRRTKQLTCVVKGIPTRRMRRKMKNDRDGRIRNANLPVVSVIIPVMNEIRTLGAVICQAAKVHPQTEVLVVANGSRDGSKELAERMGARVISFKNPLGHDVGRSIGAKEAKGEILLFLDGDIVIPAGELRLLTDAVVDGVDVALNKYVGTVKRKTVHTVVLSKHALNAILSMPHLKGASLTAIPHAMSRHAMEIIGAENLAVPPKAQAVAALKGLNVQAVHYFDVGRTNPRRRRKYGKDPLEQLILGDHLEAIHYLLHEIGSRGRLTDLGRMREMVK